MIGLSAAAALTGQAHALLILPSFDATSFATDPNAAAQATAIQTAATTIDGLYNNPGTVRVLFEFNSGLGGGAQTNTAYTFVPYSQYTNRLAAVSAANPQNTTLATAVAHLGSGNSGTYVLGTTALLRVGLGFTGSGVTPCYNAAGSAVTGCGAIYDAVISIGTATTNGQGPGQNSQALSEMEHELNEALGGGGGGTTIGDDFSLKIGSATAIGSTDLYRYQSSGSTCANVDSTPSYTTSTAAVACYSIDGGNTALVRMNQAGGGSDYGDFATTSPNVPYIQDAFYPGFTNIYSISSPEFIMMQSIGYQAVPEPATLALYGAAVPGLTWLRRRRARPV